MCNVAPDIMAKLEETVRRFLDQNRMFTAYDVTVETRSREKIQLFHKDVNGECHNVEPLVDALDYGHDVGGTTHKWLRTRRDVPGSSGAWTWVYHPSHLDPNGYQFLNTKARGYAGSPAAPVNSISVADGSTSDSGGEQDDGTFAVDFRHRLMIPTRFMREAGIQPGDECYVIPDATTNTVLVCRATPNFASVTAAVQKVEKDGELRLSGRTLRAADLQDQKFVIETADHAIAGSSVRVVAVKRSPVAAAGVN